MAMVEVVDRVTDWLNEKVCPLVEFKVPNDMVHDDSYDYRLINPTAFPMYLPTVDKLPEGVESPVPSVVVRVNGFTDDLVKGERHIQVSLLFATWDPGVHRQDIYRGTSGTMYFSTPYNQSDGDTYTKGMDGWKDAWNFLDTAIRTIENTEYIADQYRFEKEKNIGAGPVSTKEGVTDFYPYWYAVANFTIMEEIGHKRRHVKYDHLL